MVRKLKKSAKGAWRNTRIAFLAFLFQINFAAESNPEGPNIPMILGMSLFRGTKEIDFAPAGWPLGSPRNRLPGRASKTLQGVFIFAIFGRYDH